MRRSPRLSPPLGVGGLANGVVTCCLPPISGFPLVSFTPIYKGGPRPRLMGGDILFALRMPNVGRYMLSGVVIPLEIVSITINN